MRTITRTGMIAVLLSWAAVGSASDLIYTHKKGEPLRGQITEISPTEVKIDTKPLEVTVKANEIAKIKFDEEPDRLTKGRNLIAAGDFEDALKALNAIDRSTLTRKDLLQEIDYQIAYANTQLALGGSTTVNEAAVLMKNFIETNKSSYHFFEANELFGDLCVAAGRYDVATLYYDAAAKAPWQDAAARIDVKRGDALLAQGKPKEAIALYDKVIAIDTPGTEVENFRLSALLGKASALAATGAPDEGLKLVQGVKAKADKEDGDLLGRVYLAEGNCYRVANKPNEAMMAYLHVDLLYFQNPQVHAEALSRLSTLWTQLNKPERAKDAAARLNRSYPNSRWVRPQS